MSSEFERVVFTGATGSIGSQMPKGPKPLLTRLEARSDLMKEELLQTQPQPQVLIHLSALAAVSACEKNPELAYELNVKGAQCWFRAAHAAGLKRFVFVSTSHVYEQRLDQEPLTESSPLGPKSVYARTKLEAEIQLRKLAGDSGLELKIARVFSVLSPQARPTFLLHSLEQAAKNGDYNIYGLSHIRDFMEASEVCVRLLTLATKSSVPDLVLICSGKGRTVREIAEPIFKKHGRNPELLCEKSSRPEEISFVLGRPTQF